jgi:serine/threonine-protein kinase
MFLDEARLVARIQHPNVVHVQELGSHEGELFLAMEYVPGENVFGLIKRLFTKDQALDPALAAHIVAEACAGLHAAHELVGDDGKPLGLVHRDVSPQNVVVTYDGHVKVLDFGVAIAAERLAVTEFGHVKGKLEYMSPEQTRGEKLDRRSDVFALGILLYEILTSRRLFQRAGHARTVDAICKEPVVPPSRVTSGIPATMDMICLRALSKDREDRYATAAEMRSELLAMVTPGASEKLATLMSDIFADRIADKRDMLKRVGEGADITHVPPGEADEGVEIPNVPTEVMAGPPTEVRRYRRSVWLVGLGAGLVLAVGAAAAFLAAPRAPSTLVFVSPRIAALPALSEVTVRIETTPPGARVVVAGHEHGDTPYDLRLARGTREVKIELRRAGYVPLGQSVIPDKDQKLVLTMQATPRMKPVAKPKPTATATSGGFRRFD